MELGCRDDVDADVADTADADAAYTEETAETVDTDGDAAEMKEDGVDAGCWMLGHTQDTSECWILERTQEVAGCYYYHYRN